MAWAIIAASVISAGAGVYGSQQAAKQSGKGSSNAIAEQQRQYNIGLNMLEPTRSLGYGALSDLASLYGYALPSYTPVNQLLAGAGGGPITVKANGQVSGGGGQFGNPLNALPGGSLSPLGVFGHKDPLTKAIDGLFGGKESLGATINPLTGQVDVRGGHADKDALLTNYLRTGVWEGGKGKRVRGILNAIDQMRANGYQYDPEAATRQQAGPIAPAAPSAAAGQTGQAGNMSRFFTSPDYQFRLGEGIKTLDQSAAARGGLFSGNTGRSLTQFGQGLAAGEYGNYVNRLLAMAGLGQTATTQGVQLGQNTANNVSGFMQNAADARASGVMGAANSITGSINSGLNAYLLQQYMNRPTGT